MREVLAPVQSATKRVLDIGMRLYLRMEKEADEIRKTVEWELGNYLHFMLSPSRHHTSS
jgi:hypothetical protein